jgi:hypothetical protein
VDKHTHIKREERAKRERERASERERGRERERKREREMQQERPCILVDRNLNDLVDNAFHRNFHVDLLCLFY